MTTEAEVEIVGQDAATALAAEDEPRGLGGRILDNIRSGNLGILPIVVTMVVQMNQDGTPTKVDLKDTGRYYNDPTFRAAADSAMRAVSNPRCQPWPLSPEKYNAWRTITFNFDPRDY